MLLDEPFSNLDAGLQACATRQVRSILRQAGATAIFVTHDQEEALSLVDRVAVLIDGVVRQVAAPQQLYRQPADRDVASFVGDANPARYGKRARRRVRTGRFGAGERAQGRGGGAAAAENVSVMPAGADAGARVRAVLFFGHDQLVSIQLPSGRIVDARLGPMYHFAIGQPVQVKASGPVMAYAHRP